MHFQPLPHVPFSPCTQVKRGISYNEHLYHTKKKGSILITTWSHTTFGYDHLRSPIWEGPGWMYFLNRRPRGRVRWLSEALLEILLVALHAGNSEALPFSRRLCMLTGFLVEIFTGLLLVCGGQCILILPHLLDRFFKTFSQSRFNKNNSNNN